MGGDIGDPLAVEPDLAAVAQESMYSWPVIGLAA